MALLANRNNAPLSAEEQRRAVNTFVGMDNGINVRYEDGQRTRFRITHQDGEDVPEIIFGPDVYPGRNVANPNASLALDAAAAHELTHFYRWRDKTELPHGVMSEIDEALTSLQAALGFPRVLKDRDMRQLIEDAIHRLQNYVRAQLSPAPAVASAPAVTTQHQTDQSRPTALD